MQRSVLIPTGPLPTSQGSSAPPRSTRAGSIHCRSVRAQAPNFVALESGPVRPVVRSATRFARKTADLSRYLVAEWVTVLGAAQIALLLVATIGSAVDVGSLRGAQTLLGPLNILGIGAFGFLGP